MSLSWIRVFFPAIGSFVQGTEVLATTISKRESTQQVFPHLGIDFYGTEFAFHLSAMIFSLTHARILA